MICMCVVCTKCTAHNVCILLCTALEIFGVGSLGDQGICRGFKLNCHLTRRALPINLFRHFCLRMHHLATMHSVTDRQTDRQHYDANSRSYCVQYGLDKNQ